MPGNVGVGVGVLLVDGGRVLLGLRKGSHGAGTWALPGGWLETGEAFEACALRELEEETGLGAGQVYARGAAVVPVVANNVMDAGVHSVTVFVRVPLGAAPDDAGGGAPAPRIMEPDKCLKWRWCELSQPLPTPLFPPLAELEASAYWREHVATPAAAANTAPALAAVDVPPAGAGVAPSSSDPPRDSVVITPEPLPCGSLVARVVCPSAGGIATFTGTTRETFEDKKVLRLEYEAYAPMAKAQLLQLCGRARERWAELRHIAIAHRTGLVPVTEASVEVAVSSAHRKDALAACAFLIDELKAKVPIWKKEVYQGEGGAAWKENKEAFEGIGAT